MAKLTNPDAFQIEAAEILSAAYERFPTPFPWVLDRDDERYPTEKGAARATIQFHTIRWLKDNNYLTTGGLIAGEHGPGALEGAQWRDIQLTQRGLNVLNALPDVLAGKEPLGKRLAAAAKTGSVELVKMLIPAAIQAGLGVG